MATHRIDNHVFIEALGELAGLIVEANTVPGQPQPGATDASGKAQAPSCPLDLVVDTRNVE